MTDVCVTKHLLVAERTDSTTENPLDEYFEEENGRLKRDIETVEMSQNWHRNHLLNLIISNKQHRYLLRHPLISVWLRYKWEHYTGWVHYFFLLLALFQAVVLSIFTGISRSVLKTKELKGSVLDMQC